MVKFLLNKMIVVVNKIVVELYVFWLILLIIYSYLFMVGCIIFYFLYI